MYVHVGMNYFDLVVTQQNELKLYNRFKYQTKEDFIYYILFTAEQLGLNPEQFDCKFMGNIKKNDPFYDIAYKYIRNISLLSSNKMRFSVDDTTNNFTLLNSF